MTYTLRFALFVSFSALFVVGCNRQESAIRTYSTPKEAPAPPPPSMAMATEAGGRTAQAGTAAAVSIPVQWVLPREWKQIGGAGEMRIATIEVDPSDPTAVLTVTPLGPEAGSLLPNVQRWAGQLHAPDVTQVELSKFVTPTQVSGERANIVDITGAPAEAGKPAVRLLAAIIPHDGATWFFKLTAPDAIVAAQKPNFEQFIHSIRFVTPGSGSAPPVASPAAPSLGTGATSNLAKWKTPDGWTEQPGANDMRVTSFRVASGAQQAEVIISRIAEGRSGTMLDNLNRWRGQVGLAPVTSPTDAGVQQGQVGGQPGLILSYVGPQATGGGGPQQIIVAMTIVGHDNWYIKLLGPQSIVSAQEPSFRQFVNSLQFTPEPK